MVSTVPERNAGSNEGGSCEKGSRIGVRIAGRSDGRPEQGIPIPGEEQEIMKFAELAPADALLLGRKTFEGFAAAWLVMMEHYEGPLRKALGEYTDMMNGYLKHIVSTTLQEPLGWNNSTIINGNIPEEVEKVKQQDGKDILVFGSGSW
jgi:dihydrofolate reductase